MNASMGRANFTAPHKSLKNALNLIEIGMPARPSKPSLGGVIVECSESEVTLRATSFDTVISVSVSGAEVTERGISLLDHKELKKVLSAFAAGETPSVAAQMPVRVEGDVVSSPHMTTPITAYPVQEYPSLRKAAPIRVVVDGQDFLTQLGRVAPAAGRDESLPGLTGVRMSIEGRTLRLAATDRYRLVVAEVETEEFAANEEPATGTLPADILISLGKLLKGYDGPVAVGMDQDQEYVTLTFSEVQVTGAPWDDCFPKYSSLFPKECAAALSIDRKAMVRAVKKARGVLQAKDLKNVPCTLAYGPTEVTVEPHLELKERLKGRGMDVPSTVAYGSLDDLHLKSIQFNPDFLLNALASFEGDTVTLHLQKSERLKPGTFTDGPDVSGNGYKHLLMPVRIDD
ncbi:hypothetical protein [Streptomyces sp. NPDC059009]|uniref:DNA polymerase III subunit beta n=1 Tax=Streptomyces sp. NPDC059009 TaxID=3346694 RepID=UPI003673DC29